MTLKSYGLLALLFTLVSCIATNNEEISSSTSQQGVELTASVNYDIFPFSFANYPGAVSATDYHTQPIVLYISGDCRGLMNSQLSIGDGESDSNDPIYTDSSGYLVNGPDSFLFRNDQIDGAQLFQAGSDRYYAPVLTGVNSSLYASTIDCENQGSFKFTIVGHEDFSRIITDSCSHDRPFRFKINGQNSKGDFKSLNYSVQLSKEQCEKVNPCDPNFNIGTSSYRDENEIFSLKRLLTANIVGDVQDTAASYYGNYDEQKNNPMIACNPSQIFDKANDGYSEKMVNINNEYSDLYLFDDIDGSSSAPVNPIGDENNAEFKVKFNGFDHSISNLIVVPFTAASGRNASLFWRISFFYDVDIKNFQLNGNEFRVDPTFAAAGTLPALSLLGDYPNISGSSSLEQRFENIELIENDIFFLNPISAGQKTSLGCGAVTDDQCIFEYYNNTGKAKDPLYHALGSEFSQLRINFIKAMDNRFHFNDAGNDEYLFDLNEY